MAGTRPYFSWSAMKGRCKPGHQLSRWYYDKGIRVCDEWQTFEGFWRDMGSGYEDHLTLDRRDNNQHYCKDNCRWVDQKTQCRNRSSNVVLEYNGRRMTLIEWAEQLSIPHSRLIFRVRRGWSVSDTLTTPPIPGRWHKRHN